MAYTVLDAAASRFPDYKAPEHNVLERACLERGLRAELGWLAQWPPQRWAEHPAHAGGLASHWQDIHRAMLHNLGIIETSLRALAEDRLGEAERARLAGEVVPAARHAVDHLYGHHRLEDRSMFPQLLRAVPALARPLNLLEADHIVLNAVLGPFERSLAALPAADAPAAAWDAVATAGERVANVARRHIEDEEEIVIPAVLGVAR
jgi:hemerythrin-like domain-containing protein